LLHIGIETCLVTEYDDWEEQWVSNLKHTGFEMLDTFHNVGARCALAEAIGDAVIDIVREGKFPTTGVPFFTDVAFAVYNLCIHISYIWG
jgi:hypothetical protein